jgi:NADP-dependent 3-hydroxy acid dehydrogenase YdfG
MELEGKVAVITGASSGIGEGTARELADAGMKLILTARQKQLLDKIAAQLDTEVATIAGDITNESLPQRLIDTAIEKFGSCDVVFNNAGVMIVGKAEDIDLEAVCWMVRINVEAVYRLAIVAMRHMLSQASGYLINTSSILGMKVRQTTGAYAGTKCAVEALTEDLRVQAA